MEIITIESLIKEVKQCLKNECALAALIVALTIPDICGKILYPNDSNSQRYKKWFNKYIGDYEQSIIDKEKPKDEQMPYMNGDVFYKLRCAILHEGSDDISSKINIHEFNLCYNRSARLENTSILKRTDYLVNESVIEYSKVIVWNINVYYLCEKIIYATEIFLKSKNKC